MPKKIEDAEIIMSLSLAGLDPQGIFDESEINVQLSAWLDGITAENTAADYVALRRDLVDHDFLRRATDGAIYRINGARIQETLSETARDVNPRVVFAEVQLERRQRRTAFRQ